MRNKITVTKTLKSPAVFLFVLVLMLPFYYAQSKVIGFNLIGPGVVMPLALSVLFSLLIREIFRQKDLLEKGKGAEFSHSIDKILTQLAQLGIKSRQKDLFLEEAINLIANDKTFELKPKCAILLRKPGTNMYQMRVHRNLSPLVVKKCQQIIEGKGVCGLTARTKKTQFEICEECGKISNSNTAEKAPTYSSPILNPDGDVIALLVYFMDKKTSENGNLIIYLENISSLLSTILYQYELREAVFNKTSEIERSNRMLRAVIDNIPQGVNWVSPKLSIIGGNKKFISDLNLTSEKEITGKHIFEFSFGPEQDKQSEKLIQAAIHSKQALYNIKRTINIGEHTMHMTVNLMPIIDEKGKVEMVTSTYEDITEKLIREERVNQLNEELLMRNDEIKRYAEITSHNLRAPLSNIMGLVTLMQNPEMSEEEIRELLAGLDESAKKVDEIYHDLIENLNSKEKLNIALQPLDIQSVTRNVINKLNPDIEEIGAHVICDYKAQITLYSFEPFIESILFNLITNALKFKHPDRKSEIHIWGEEDSEKVTLFVKDNGLGIAKKNLKEIFNFQSRFHDIKLGKGLGLYYADIQTQTLGGKIEVTSVEGEGSTFTVVLPKRKITD